MVVIPLPPAKKTVVVQRSPMLSENTVLSSMALVSPTFPKRHLVVNVEPPPQLDAFRSDAPGAKPGGGNVLGGILGEKASAVIAPILPDTLRVVHMGGEVRNSRPLDRLNLVYPQLARAAHVMGRVIIQAMIDETGKVVNVRAISGPPLLYLAAVEAVAKERFEPMLLNGAPTECDLKVQVSFNLSDF